MANITSFEQYHKILRLSKGWTWREYSDKLGIKPNKIKRIESGKRPPAPEIVAKMIQVFGLEGSAALMFRHLAAEARIRYIKTEQKKNGMVATC